MAKTRLPVPPPRKAFDSSLAIINIVLLLIFFFLTTGSLMSSRTVEVNLPDTTRLPLDLLPEPLLVVTTEGDMTLNGAPVEAGTLADALIDSPTVYVLTDRDLNASTLLTMLDEEALIAVDVQLVTLHLKGGSDEE